MSKGRVLALVLGLFTEFALGESQERLPDRAFQTFCEVVGRMFWTTNALIRRTDRKNSQVTTVLVITVLFETNCVRHDALDRNEKNTSQVDLSQQPRSMIWIVSKFYLFLCFVTPLFEFSSFTGSNRNRHNTITVRYSIQLTGIGNSETSLLSRTLRKGHRKRKLRNSIF